jgi:hypothetical protein
VRTEPGGDEEPANIALAEDELVVRGERLGPLIIRVTSASAMDGTRAMAPSMISSNRGQSGSSSRWLKSGGMPSRDQGAGLRS